MKQRYGVILLERTEVVIRIYEVANTQWKLLKYYNKQIAQTPNDPDREVTLILETLNECLLAEYAQHIADWRTCARFLPQPLLQIISQATGFKIENLTHLREQELLCKGMFTELW